jgi:surface carbohydrate biosynthesis protein
MNTNGLLLIPVENQVRELDPKLLLACVAARRGFTSVIGSRREMEMGIDAFPRGIYLSKSMTVRSLLFFQIAHRLGHEIVTWDEEALVHLPPETYFSRRLHPSAIRFVSHLFAWGPANVDLWRQYPDLPPGTPIHATGNPRGDLLRPELRNFYREEARQIAQRYGKFILVNTNFNHINAFGDDLNLFQSVQKPGETPKFGRAARGMSLAYAEGLRDHKTAVFKDFKRLIPELERAFPDHTVVVRPHPTEKHDDYQKLAADCQRIEVTNAGNVVPWLMAAQAVIHNGCTTGVEAYVLGIPAISYRASIDETYDNGFYRLPNKISYQCFSFEELQAKLAQILNGKIGSADGDERKALIDHYLAGQDGALACEQIVEQLEKIRATMQTAAPPSSVADVQKRVIAGGLYLARWIQPKLPGSHNRPEFQRHRYPVIAMEEVMRKLNRFQELLHDDLPLKIEPVSDVIFKVPPGGVGPWIEAL